MANSSTEQTPKCILSHSRTCKSLKGGSGLMRLPPFNNDILLLETRKWIEERSGDPVTVFRGEECTGTFQPEKSYADYLMDGTVLCNLIQHLRPGLIRKINKHRNTFAWRENLTFFLEACVHLGLRDSQLFSSDDLLSTASSTSPYKAKTVLDREKNLRKIALTIYWLYHTLDQSEPLNEVKSSDTSSSEKSEVLNNTTEDTSQLTHSRSFSPTDHYPYPHSAKVQKFTSIVTETQSSDIQFFPEVIVFEQSSCIFNISQPYEVPTTCPSKRLSREQLHSDSSQRKRCSLGDCDENTFTNTVQELDWITSSPKHLLKSHNHCSREDSENDFHNLAVHSSVIDPALSCFQKDNSMEEDLSSTSPMHKESNSVNVEAQEFTSTSNIKGILTSNKLIRTHPIPHHSLTVSLSDPESQLSNQVDSTTSVEISRDKEVLPDDGNTSRSAQTLLTQSEQNISDSHSSLHLGDDVTSGNRSLVTRKSSFLSSVMQVADKHATKTSRPMSAPSRSSSNVIVSGSSTTLPSQLNRSELRFLKDHQHSEDTEKQRRRVNIDEGARAALHYSAKRQSLKAMSLPRDHRSSLNNAAALKSSISREEEFDHKASPAVIDNTTGEVKGSSVMHINELWNQVENCGSDKANKTAVGADPSVIVDSSANEFRLSSSDVDDRDATKSSIEEKDIFVSFEESQPQLVVGHDQQSISSGGVYTNTCVSHTVNEEKGRHRAASFSNKQIDSLLETLRSLSARDEEVEELNILEGMLKSNTFKKAKHVHDNMHSLLFSGPDVPKPVVKRVVPTVQLMRQHLHHHAEPSFEVDDLRKLLRAPHIQAVLLCHDKVSTRDLYIPDTHFHRRAQDPVDIILSDSVYNFQVHDDPIDMLSRDVPSSRKEDATIVFLERSNRPLGCTIYKQEDSVFFGKLLKGCDAEASEMLREGDELIEINGVPVIGKSTDEIVTLMSSDVEPGVVLALTIIPVHDDNVDLEYEPKYVKAHFSYNAKHDEDIPCKTLGLNFQKGDILEISNHDDPEWWQARKVFDDGAESLPGLIPSRHLQQQREALIRSYPFASVIEKKKGFKSVFSKRKKKKIFYQSTSTSTSFGVGDEVPTYEDVMKLEPCLDVIRPIVLVGAPGVGRRTLIRKLLNSNTSQYLPVVQNTTRPARPGEINGQDYFFVTREEFECDIEQDRFLEYGELKGFYYGTTFSSIKKIIESHRVPVLELHPQALKKVRHCGLKPYIVFIASPRLERLHITRKMASDKFKKRLGSTLQHQDSSSRKFQTESDLQNLVQESYLIENQYGHYFDWIIINDDFQVAADMLKEVAQRVCDEPQWVPKLWQSDNHY